MNYSKQKLVLSLLIEFSTSFANQANESAVDQEFEQFIKNAVKELSTEQGKTFDKKVHHLLKEVNREHQERNLEFSEYTENLWKEISQMVQRSTSFSTAYALMNLFGGSKNASLKL